MRGIRRETSDPLLSLKVDWWDLSWGGIVTAREAATGSKRQPTGLLGRLLVVVRGPGFHSKGLG